MTDLEKLQADARERHRKVFSAIQKTPLPTKEAKLFIEKVPNPVPQAEVKKEKEPIAKTIATKRYDNAFDSRPIHTRHPAKYTNRKAIDDYLPD